MLPEQGIGRVVIISPMKKLSLIITVLVASVFGSCSAQYCLQKRTDRLISKAQKDVDTVYLYSVAFNDFNLIWYHKDNSIHSYKIKPYSTEHNKPISIEESVIVKEDINKYFNGFLNKDIKCFEPVLDGEWIKMYVKGKEPLFSSIDIECLFGTRFDPDSFPYWLQYDLYKLGRCPQGYSFEAMYSIDESRFQTK